MGMVWLDTKCMATKNFTWGPLRESECLIPGLWAFAGESWVLEPEYQGRCSEGRYRCTGLFLGSRAAGYTSLKGSQISPTVWAEEGGRGFECQGHASGEWELVFISLDARALPVLLPLLEVTLFLWSFPPLKFHLLGCHLSLVVWTGLGQGWKQ